MNKEDSLVFLALRKYFLWKVQVKTISEYVSNIQRLKTICFVVQQWTSSYE